MLLYKPLSRRAGERGSLSLICTRITSLRSSASGSRPRPQHRRQASPRRYRPGWRQSAPEPRSPPGRRRTRSRPRSSAASPTRSGQRRRSCRRPERRRWRRARSRAGSDQHAQRIAEPSWLPNFCLPAGKARANRGMTGSGHDRPTEIATPTAVQCGTADLSGRRHQRLGCADNGRSWSLIEPRESTPFCHKRVPAKSALEIRPSPRHDQREG
jgi:hypothetical protein